MPQLVRQFVSHDLLPISFCFNLYNKIEVLYLFKVHNHVISQKFCLTFTLKLKDLSALKPQ